MSPQQYQSARRKIGTQTEVAEMLALDPQTISRRERGELPITPEAALAILALRKPKRPRRQQNTKMTNAESEAPSEKRS